MNLLVTGASGLIGSAACVALAAAGHTVIPLRRNASQGPTWNPTAGQINLTSAGTLDAILHLAGETVAQRWTTAARKRIRESRVEGTHLLCEALARLPQRPRALVCASAIGFYGDRGEEMLEESSAPGSGFLAEVTQAWETACAPAVAAGLRVVHLRFGIVLARQGGALAKMLPVFRLGLGGPVGSGRQYWSWIALDDAVAVLQRAVEDETWRGPINVVAPQAATNREFTATLSRVLRRPAVLPVPGIAVKFLCGEMGREMLLGSARVRPARLLATDFGFRFPNLEGALAEALI